MTKSVVVVGVGNILCGDDGVGSRAAQLLQSSSTLPRGVRIVDAGTLGPDLLAHLQPGEAVVLMDAVRGGGAPGTLYRLHFDSLEEPASVPLSLHELGIHELLHEAKLLGRPLRGILLGIEPARLVPGEMHLSPAVQRALESLIQTALEEAERLGHDDGC